MIGRALSSAGNGVIDENINGLALKMASSAILGGTISEIGGGKFANGAITGAYSMLFNDLMHDLQKQTKKYIDNEHKLVAIGVTMEALLETTQSGDLLTNVREKLVDVYGTQNDKEVSEVYSKAVSIIKTIKNDTGIEKMTDLYTYVTVVGLAAESIKLQTVNFNVAYKIKSLDINTYYQLVEP